jgi:outer membrane protein OmpA-like peptidoglycan-associated protein
LSVFSQLFFLAGCAAPGPNDPNYDSAKRKNVSVKQTNRGVEVTVNESIFFDTGKYELKSGSGDVLDRLATILKDRSKKDILVEGHTDSISGAQANQRSCVGAPVGNDERFGMIDSAG